MAVSGEAVGNRASWEGNAIGAGSFDDEAGGLFRAMYFMGEYMKEK